MIPTTTTTFDGVRGLIVPSEHFFWPVPTFENFPSACGSGLTEVLVPETMWGLCVSPACWIHDRMFEQASQTWNDFYQANEVFEHNLRAIIDQKTTSRLLRMARYQRAHTYVTAVYGVGALYFFEHIFESHVL